MNLCGTEYGCNECGDRQVCDMWLLYHISYQTSENKEEKR